MKHFAPPVSGQLLGVLREVLGVPLNGLMVAPNTAKKFFSGELVTEQRGDEVIDDLIRLTLEADWLDLGSAAPPRRFVTQGITVTALLWDRFAGQAAAATSLVSELPHAPRALARVLTIELALRLAALRQLSRLPPMEEWFRAAGPGELIRDLVKGQDYTGAAFDIGVDRKTLVKWCSRKTPTFDLDEESITKLTAFAVPGPEGDSETRRNFRRKLRRHLGAWRLARIVRRALGRVFGDEVLAALVRLTNAFSAELASGRDSAVDSVPEEERQERWRVLLFRLAIEGRWCLLDESNGVPVLARQLRILAAQQEEDPRWANALRSDDLRHIQSHVAMLGGLRLQRETLLRRGAPRAMVDRIYSDAMWDSPPVGLVPVDGATAGDPQVALAASSAHAASVGGDVEQALEARLAFVSLHPGDAVGRMQLGALFGEAGLLEEAVRECSRAVDLDPNLVPARVELAAQLVIAGRPREALVHLEEAVRRSGLPPTAEMLYQTGLAQLALDEPELAHDVLQQALKLSPHDGFIIAAATEAAQRSGRAWDATHLARQARHRGGIHIERRRHRKRR